MVVVVLRLLPRLLDLGDNSSGFNARVFLSILLDKSLHSSRAGAFGAVLLHTCIARNLVFFPARWRAGWLAGCLFSL